MGHRPRQHRTTGKASKPLSTTLSTGRKGVGRHLKRTRQRSYTLPRKHIRAPPHATDGRKICPQGPLVVTYQKSFCGMHTIMSSSKRLPGNYLCLSRCILGEIWTSPNMTTYNCSFIHATLFRRFVGPGEVLNAGWKATWLPPVQITASLALYVNQDRARNLRSPHRNRLDKRNLVQSTIRFVAARMKTCWLPVAGSTLATFVVALATSA